MFSASTLAGSGLTFKQFYRRLIGPASLLLLLASCSGEADLGNKDQKGTPGTAGDSTAVASAPLPENDPTAIEKGATVWVNTDSVLANYTWYKDTKATLEAKGKRAEADLTNRMEAFQQEYASAQQKAQSGSLGASQMQELERSIMQKQQGLQAYKEQQGRKLMDEERKLNEQLSKTLRTYFKKFASEHGYAYVMGYSEPGPVLYADPKLDVTKAVIEGLNEELKAGKQ